MKNVMKYIGFYNAPGAEFSRSSSLAATEKMDYICDVLCRLGNIVHIISPSWFIANTKAKYQRSKKVTLKEQKLLTLAPSFGEKTRLLRFTKISLSLIWLLWHIIVYTRKNEKILVYHSPWLSWPIRWAKRIRRLHIVLEVEELYADATPIGALLEIWEKKLLSAADSFLFSTEMLEKKIGKGKPCCIIYGRYQAADSIAHPPDDGKIHLLYAGIIDSNKKGAFNALESTRYLPANYVLHIVGFGEIDKLQERINQLKTTNKCRVVFDGQKRGDEYIRYAQSCHIGLSTQSMDGKYLGTSFPSKILSYLSMGLRVVSCHVECVNKSTIKNLVTYYYRDTPKAIADAIISIDLNKSFNAKLVIQRMDHEIASDINTLMLD